MTVPQPIPRKTANFAGGFAVVLLTLAVMLTLTWRTWPEPVVDFGRELYVPWQLSQGKTLYRDVAYFNGPLSPYFNALIFRISGVSLMALVGANLAIFTAILLMFYWLAMKVADVFAATAACCAFVVLLGCGQPGPVGNYNYLTPYSHEMTHGLALSLAAIVCVVKFGEQLRTRWVTLAGALVGMVFLTKPEIFVAAGISAVAGIMLRRRGRPEKSKAITLFFFGVLMSIGVGIGLLAITLPIYEAASGVTMAWRGAVDARITSNPFYQRVRGTFDLADTSYYLAVMSFGYGAVFLLPAMLARILPGDGGKRLKSAFLSFTIIAMTLLFWRDSIRWEEIGRPLIIVVVIGLLVSFQRLARVGEPVRFLLLLFAGLMLAKIGLHVQLYHYGFVLAAPALIVTILAVLCWWPAWIDGRGANGTILRGAGLASVVVTCVMYLQHEKFVVDHKTTTVGVGADAFYAFPVGESVNRIIKRLDQLSPGATVAVVPQGAMLNYLTRRASSIPYIVQMPPEVMMFSSDRITGSFANSPPDYVLLLDTDTSEYGLRGYTVDFGKPMFDWIRAHYQAESGETRETDLKWILFRKKEAG